MNDFLSRTKLRHMAALAAAAILLGTAAAIADDTGAPRQSVRNEYVFPRTDTPMKAESYSTTVYTSGAHSVQTMRGDMLHYSPKHTITTFSLNPAGNSFVIVDRDRKGVTSASVYDTDQTESRRHKFDATRLGMPTAAVFTPDARRLAVASDRGIFILDAIRFKPVDQISLVPVRPAAMAVSPNGYFLALVDGKDVVVYNLEEKTIRKRIDAEVGVADLTFSDDSSTMAVLTDDGLLSLYDTRTFDVRNIIDDLEGGLACDFNGDGKYIAVAETPGRISVINLLRTSDRQEIASDTGGIRDVTFALDSEGNPLLAYGSELALNVRRMTNLEPYYSRLVSETVDGQMAEWLKMQPGESLEDYNRRVNDESRKAHRRLLEDRISTQLAGDMLAMSSITLGNYDRANGLLAVDFTNLPTIYLPVPESDLEAFTSGADLTVSDAQYGVLPDDSFELIYARFLNRNDGKTYVYDNLDRVPMQMIGSEADFVSLDIIRQQQMEELRLQEVKERVMAEAKSNNVITDHTNITVDSRVVPAYDANGNKILNYIVKFAYEVEPGFSATEDFAPGGYHISQSGAATSMLEIVKKAFATDFAQYLTAGKRLEVDITGTADATPIVRTIAYDGTYGDFEGEPVTIDGQLTTVTATRKDGIRTNEQLAFLRAAAVKNHLTDGITALADMNCDYNYRISVSKDKGSEFRRITAEFTFVDAF